MNNTYILYLTIDNEDFILLNNDLIKIDEFNSFFKTKEAILLKLFEGTNFDYSSVSISIRKNGVNLEKVPINCSDFKKAPEIFSDKNSLMNFLDKIKSIDASILLKYFLEKKDEKEKMNKKNSLVSKIAKDLEYVNNTKKYLENRDEYYITSTNLTYNIRNYCNKYENFRDFFSYLQGLGLLKKEKLVYREEERNEFFETFEYIKVHLSLFLEKINEKRNKEKEFRSNLELDASKAGEKLLTQNRLNKDAKKVAKKRILSEEAIEIGKKILKDEEADFELEYIDNSFKNYLKEYSPRNEEEKDTINEEINTLIDLDERKNIL